MLENFSAVKCSFVYLNKVLMLKALMVSGPTEAAEGLNKMGGGGVGLARRAARGGTLLAV